MESGSPAGPRSCWSGSPSGSDDQGRQALVGPSSDCRHPGILQDTRTIDRAHEDPWLVGFELESDLIVLDLAGSWPTKAGASQAIATGRRDVAQAWSRSIHAAYPDIDGLVYPSAMAGRAMNVALYERGAATLPTRPFLNVPLSHPGLTGPINRIAARYGYDLR